MGADLVEHFGIAIEDGHLPAEPDRHLRGVETDHAATDHDDLARHHAGDAAQQDAAPAMRLFERGRPGLDAHPSGNLAHRFQERQAAIGVGDGFIGDAHRLRFDEVARLFGIGREMEIGIEDLPLAQHGALVCLRLLDLDDHFGALEDFRGGFDDLGALRAVIVVACADAFAGAGFDQHLMAVNDQLARAFGRQANAIFVVLDFLRAADQHHFLP